MPDRESVDTERTVVTTYIPAYQKAEWEDHAENLDMSQSEFVRSMVQAGRRDFRGVPSNPDGNPRVGTDRRIEDNDPSDIGAEKRHDNGSNPGGSLAEAVIQTLEDNGPLSWEELVERVIGDIEDELDETIRELQNENTITHSPRAGKYVLNGD